MHKNNIGRNSSTSTRFWLRETRRPIYESGASVPHTAPLHAFGRGGGAGGMAHALRGLNQSPAGLARAANPDWSPRPESAGRKQQGLEFILSSSRNRPCWQRWGAAQPLCVHYFVWYGLLGLPVERPLILCAASQRPPSPATRRQPPEGSNRQAREQAVAARSARCVCVTP